MSIGTDAAGYYNAAVDIIDHNLASGRGQKTAVIDRSGSHSYQELSDILLLDGQISVYCNAM